MSKEIKAVDVTNLPAEMMDLFDVDTIGDDLSSGVSGGFGILSFRGSKWRIKHNGEETLLTNDEGDPIPSIKLVFLKANKNISKVYYDHKYVEGSDDPPTCISVNGVLPDSDSQKPQSESCAACVHNQWGSRITEAGKKAKACQDSRRIAVVPEGDLENEAYGGPILLRVPAASLNDLKSYSVGMKTKGFPYNLIVTKVGFDGDASYPKLTFSAARPITDDERDEVVAHLRSDKVETVLTQEDAAPSPVAPTAPKPENKVVSLEFEDSEPDKPAKPPKSKKKKKKKAKEEASAVEAPVIEEPAKTDDADPLAMELDSIVSSIEAG